MTIAGRHVTPMSEQPKKLGSKMEKEKSYITAPSPYGDSKDAKVGITKMASATCQNNISITEFSDVQLEASGAN